MVVAEAAGEYGIRPAPDRLPGLLSGSAPDGRTVGNRLRLGIRPDDRQAEVARLLALGARHADVGRNGDGSWGVLAGPEGDEFRAPSSRRT